MERWFKTGSIRPKNRKPTTVDQSKEDINCCSKNVLESTIPDVENLKGNKKRKYDDSYLDMGFTEFSDGRPQCVICNKVLPNSSMFPAKLRRHFKTHPDFTNKTADYFKIAQLGKDHSILSSKAKLLLLPFGTTYLCETAFSRYTATKTKYRSRLDAEDDMRLQLTSVIPDIEKLSSKKQAHCSH